MTVREILATYRHIAIVGISDRPARASSDVSRYLMQAGYTILPVNPNRKTVFGLECHPSISAMPAELKRKIEIVDIFRKPRSVEPIVDEAIEAGAKVVWMQPGAANEEAAEKARKAGLEVVLNRCMAVEHRRLFT
ncbi:CoA-binding protein [Prosthecochloris sp. GSB1]|uniref:CoA-binding protein n=1 Tax=Prosthecochloris sp. GSB1 TaxID=281093 RepID=UPI000B8C85B5|nr:CoA-binding protein [Prosthecochloris sp. GSB1]ASQ90205.1 CoA-binding protein [Prosthecochloris sp. GSB1]